MREADPVRTTLDIDADVLRAAKAMASAQGTTVGRVISDLVRQALKRDPAAVQVRNGVPLMPRRPPGFPPVTAELVQDVLDEE
jgi:hypothetical protein